jgi:PAS domain S-box-containing protein
VPVTSKEINLKKAASDPGASVNENQSTRACRPFTFLQEETSVQAALEVVSGSANHSVFHLGKEKITIGRASQNDLVLEDPKVSRSHAQVYFKEGRYIIEDLGSTNGVYIDGKRVEKAELEPGSRITLGEVQMVFTKRLPETPSLEKTAFMTKSELLSVLNQETTAHLLESESKYKTLVENVPLIVYRLQNNGSVAFINQFAEEVFGYSTAELCGNPALWTELVHEEDRRRVMALREQCLKEGKEFLSEYRIRNKNGQIMYLMDHAIPSRSPYGELTGVDGVIMDMTGRAKLQEKALRAEELRTIREVSSRLAHEIRNPLVSAGGFARRLVDSLSPEDPNRYKAEIIVKEMGRLELILRMVLTYIQPVELKSVPSELNSLIERVVAGALETTGEKTTVHSELAASLPLVPLDPEYMERILDALLKNAFSQMPENGTLYLDTRRADNMVQVTISYPAEHISQDDVEHFFFPFTTPKVQSVAADLPLSRVVLHKLGGDIQVSMDEPGKLLIRILLPIGEA